jgi:hypothetical protein
MSRVAHIALVALLVSGMAKSLYAADRNPKLNKEILFQACRDAVAGFISETQIPDTTEIVLMIEGGEINRFFAQVLTESFRRRFSSVFTQHATSGVEISASIGDAAVIYEQAFSESFFSARRCERQVEVGVRMTAMRSVDGKILWAGTKSSLYTDTVYVSDIPKLQQSSEHIARGVMPQRSAMERFIEPFIIVSAAGVAVYLFFTIRR